MNFDKLNKYLTIFTNLGVIAGLRLVDLKYYFTESHRIVALGLSRKQNGNLA